MNTIPGFRLCWSSPFVCLAEELSPQAHNVSLEHLMTKQFTFFAEPRLATLITVFDRLFRNTYNTVLVGGASEPLYAPSAAAGEPHRIVFTRDYFSSALHEIAHWCIAGEERRLQTDYGYWYAPDGRDGHQQAAFERVEVKPQALERIFSQATGQPFRVSADNLDAAMGASDAFLQALHKQTLRYCAEGLPARADTLVRGLVAAFAGLELVSVNVAEAPLKALQADCYRFEDLL